MAVTHAKVSGVADGGDTNLIRPSDWNANHLGALGYNLAGHGAKWSPADNTTYYFGSVFSYAPSTTEGLARIYIPVAGTITKCYVNLYTNGTNGTTEASTLYIRLNATTDTSVSASLTTNNDSCYVSNTGLSIAVVAGDYIEFKFVGPSNWSTNPTNCYITAVIYIE